MVNKSTFFGVFKIAGSLSVTAITSLLALRPREDDSMCTLTKTHEDAFAMTASLLNSSCTYSLKVGPAGVTSC